jgi:hypothetical protein
MLSGRHFRIPKSLRSLATRTTIWSLTGRTDVRSRPAGADRADVPAAHGDNDIGRLDLLGGEPFGDLAGDVDADLGHGPDDGGVELAGGLRAG